MNREENPSLVACTALFSEPLKVSCESLDTCFSTIDNYCENGCKINIVLKNNYIIYLIHRSLPTDLPEKTYLNYSNNNVLVKAVNF